MNSIVVSDTSPVRALEHLGLLARAKARLLTDVRPLMDRLCDEIDFHLSASVRDEVLRLADEE